MSLADGRYRIAVCAADGARGLYVRTDTTDGLPPGSNHTQRWISGLVDWADVEGDQVGDILVIEHGRTSTIKRVHDWHGPQEEN